MNRNLPERWANYYIARKWFATQCQQQQQQLSRTGNEMDKTVKYRYHPLLFQYHSTNTRSTLQKRLSRSMDNSTSRKPANRTKNLWSTEGDNEKSKHTRKHQRCMDQAIWNTSTEKRCIKGNWIWKESTTKWAQQCGCSDWSENADLAHNIIPPEKNATEQPNDINENGLLEIKKTLLNAYAESIVTPFHKRFNLRKPGKKIKKTWRIFGKS